MLNVHAFAYPIMFGIVQVLGNLASPYGVANQTRSTSVAIGPNCLPYKTGLTEAPDWSELRDVRAGHH